MKTFMITLVAVAALGLTSVQAQVTDTTRIKQTDPTYNPPTQPGNQYNQQDYSQLRSNDVPASLRTTLKGNDYSGWENGMLYRNRTDNGYMLRIGEGADTRSYYFDKGGKKIDPPAGSQMQNTTPESQRTQPSTQPQYQQQPNANPQPNAKPQQPKK